MKKSAKVALLSCFMLVLAVVFGTTHSASAHDGSMYTTTAQEASTGTMEDMRDFVLHVKEHREQLRTYDQHAEFRNAMRTDDGTWKSGTTYVITVNRTSMGLQNLRAGEVISFHAEHDDALDESLRHIGIFEELMTEVEKPSAGEQPVCVQDETGDHGNHICAVQTTIRQTGTQNTLITVAGFNHELGDADDSKALEACSNPPLEYFDAPGTGSDGETTFTRVNAKTLDTAPDKDALKNYVKTVEEHIINEIDIFRDFLSTIPGYDQMFSDREQRGHITGRLVRLRRCWREENWKSGSIYFVIFRHEGGKRYSVFNGLSPALKDSTLELYDGCVDVDQLIVKALEEQDEDDRFFEYYWSNPAKTDDKVRDDDGNPIPGLSPGTSLKMGYVLPTTFGGATEGNFVILSGIYPEGDKDYYIPESGMCHPIPDNLSASAREHLHKYPVFPEQKKDDGGCAIASGDQSNMKIAGFNLFLLAVVLFSAIWGKSRSGGKFWTPKP